MERFLENVADSVSQLVLFSVEPSEPTTDSTANKIVEQSARALQDTSKYSQIGLRV